MQVDGRRGFLKREEFGLQLYLFPFLLPIGVALQLPVCHIVEHQGVDGHLGGQLEPVVPVGQIQLSGCNAVYGEAVGQEQRLQFGEVQVPGTECQTAGLSATVRALQRHGLCSGIHLETVDFDAVLFQDDFAARSDVKRLLMQAENSLLQLQDALLKPFEAHGPAQVYVRRLHGTIGLVVQPESGGVIGTVHLQLQIIQVGKAVAAVPV